MLSNPIVGIKTLAFYGLIRRPTTSYQHSCCMVAITLQKAFELMFYLLTAMLSCKGVFLPVLAGYLLSEIPDGPGMFLKAICEGHRDQAQDCDVRCLPTGQLAELCKTQAHLSKAIICVWEKEGLPREGIAWFFFLVSHCVSVSVPDTQVHALIDTGPEPRYPANNGSYPKFCLKNRGTSLC
jgi:hypothetical protein